MIFKKDMWKEKKTLFQWILQNIVENQVSQGTAKYIEMKDIVVLVKLDNMYNILKSLPATGYWSWHEGGTVWSSFLLEP